MCYRKNCSTTNCWKIQLPLSNCAVVALDYDNFHGIATSIGHSPISGLIDPKKEVLILLQKH